VSSTESCFLRRNSICWNRPSIWMTLRPSRPGHRGPPPALLALERAAGTYCGSA
jgi:hypothetical protein